MQDLGWRRRWGSCPAARRGARQRAGLTPASASNTLTCLLEMLHSKQLISSKCWLTVITVSTASGGNNETTRVHIGDCRRDSLAARSARAAVGDAGDRISPCRDGRG